MRRLFALIGDEDHSPLMAAIYWMIATPISMAIGGICCVLAFVLLTYNELSTAVRGDALDRGPQRAVTVPIDRVDPAREGALVHVTGQAVATDEVVDPDVGVAAPGLRLMRTVEMYQWVERSRRDRRRGVTEYEYAPSWMQTWQDSTALTGPDAPRNPAMPLRTQEWLAEEVTVGAFRLDSAQVERMGDRVPLSLAGHPATRQAAVGTFVRHGDEYYLGRDPEYPEIGDLRISYSVFTPGPVSILAAQAGNSFAPYRVEVPLPAARTVLKALSPSSGEVDIVRAGTLTVQELVQSDRRLGAAMTWTMRLVGVLLMVVGVKLLIWPGAVLLRVMPTVRRLVKHGRRWVATRLGVGLALITAAFTWVLGRGLMDEQTALYTAAGAAMMLVGWVALAPELPGNSGGMGGHRAGTA
jgi:hypothetical protein